MAEVFVYYEVTEENVQLPNGLPGLTNALNRVDVGAFTEGPNASLARQAIMTAGLDGDIEGRGVITPVLMGQAYEVNFLVTPIQFAEAGSITLPLADIPGLADVISFGYTNLLVAGEAGSDYAFTATLSKIVDGAEVTAGGPTLDYDGAAVLNANPANPASWEAWDVSDATHLKLSISDISGGGSGVDLFPVPIIVKATISTGLWS